MGGANFLGRDRGMPYSESQTSFECFCYWTGLGLIISFVISIIAFPKPNFIIPFSVYFVGAILLFIRYLKIEKRNLKND